MSVQLAQKALKCQPTPNGKGLTCTIKVAIRDSGMYEVNGIPMWNEHPESGTSQAIAALLGRVLQGGRLPGRLAKAGPRDRDRR